MDMFDYEQFNKYYDSLKKTIGTLDSDDNSIGGIINTANADFNNGIEYASDSLWAKGKIEKWNEDIKKVKETFVKLSNLLDQANAVSNRYDEFDNK